MVTTSGAKSPPLPGVCATDFTRSLGKLRYAGGRPSALPGMSGLGAFGATYVGSATPTAAGLATALAEIEPDGLAAADAGTAAELGADGLAGLAACPQAASRAAEVLAAAVSRKCRRDSTRLLIQR